MGHHIGLEATLWNHTGPVVRDMARMSETMEEAHTRKEGDESNSGPERVVHVVVAAIKSVLVQIIRRNVTYCRC
jgi:hypothetical protein